MKNKGVVKCNVINQNKFDQIFQPAVLSVCSFTCHRRLFVYDCIYTNSKIPLISYLGIFECLDLNFEDNKPFLTTFCSQLWSSNFIKCSCKFENAGFVSENL